VLGVKPLLSGRILVQGGGRVMTLSFTLMHGTMLLVVVGGVLRGMPTRLDGACSGQLGTPLC
jgi:hypothetical protein